MSQPFPDPSQTPFDEGKVLSPKAASAAAEEVDVWWGSYSGWALLPSTLVCVVLTGLIGLGAWSWLERGWMRLAFLGLSGTVWLIQGLRWGYHYFTCNYRLTTRRVFRDKGFLFPEFVQVDLDKIISVEVKQTALENLLGVGRIILQREDHQPFLVLEGVHHPQEIEALIRAYQKKAKPS
jgi:hypothetical protein